MTPSEDVDRIASAVQAFTLLHSWWQPVYDRLTKGQYRVRTADLNRALRKRLEEPDSPFDYPGQNRFFWLWVSGFMLPRGWHMYRREGNRYWRRDTHAPQTGTEV